MGEPKPTDYDIRVFCLAMAHDAEESTAETVTRAEMYHDFLSKAETAQSVETSDSVVAFRRPEGGRPL